VATRGFALESQADDGGQAAPSLTGDDRGPTTMSSDAPGSKSAAAVDRSRLWTAAYIVAMLIAGAGLVIGRRPEAVTNPQFWAEDGRYWFADAYNLGIRAVLKSDEGYLLTLPRLVAAPVAGLSLSHAALVFNLVGIAVQVAPAA
jgi:hypothetical protein